MKNTVLKFYITSLFLFFSSIILADPSSGNDTENLENADTSPAPIDDYLWFLVVLGILFAVYTFKKNRKTT